MSQEQPTLREVAEAILEEADRQGGRVREVSRHEIDRLRQALKASQEVADTRLVVTTEGGAIQAMFSNDPNIDVKVVDWDEAECGTPDEKALTAKFKAASKGMRDVSNWTLLMPRKDQ